eukprot:590958-Hanusia_phi.AAC.1
MALQSAMSWLCPAPGVQLLPPVPSRLSFRHGNRIAQYKGFINGFCQPSLCANRRISTYYTMYKPQFGHTAAMFAQPPGKATPSSAPASAATVAAAQHAKQ